jgi:deazaflavin-dependent oxidoreductase (nitroreductase family)
VPYLRPPLLVRKVFNPIVMRFGIGGSQAVTVAGRRTGQPRTVPVIPVVHEGATYLVSPRGETEWVRNLRAAGGCELGRHGRQRPMRATELPVAERPAVIAAYRSVAGRSVRSFFESLPDPADHPVFRVEAR